MTRAVLVAAAGLLVAGCKSNPPWAQPAAGVSGDSTIGGEPFDIKRFSSPPQLDGKLDEAVWAGANIAGPFVDPGDGAPASDHPVATWARLGSDDQNLYLGLVVRDRSPSSKLSKSDDDPHVWALSSGIELMLQPGDLGDNRDYYELQIDVAGAVFDSHFDDYNQPITGEGAARRFGHQEWSSGVSSAIFVQQGRFYSVEAALPWRALAATNRVAVPPRAGDVWRANLYSFRDGQRLAVAWSPLKRQGNFHKTARFGRIRF